MELKPCNNKYCMCYDDNCQTNCGFFQNQFENDMAGFETCSCRIAFENDIATRPAGGDFEKFSDIRRKIKWPENQNTASDQMDGAHKMYEYLSKAGAESLPSHEYICKKCGLRQDPEKIEPNF